ncbi:MAG: UbiH/UbiF/VisC/COQ6 family ubiquinone biosynthesis hydroxylase [Gammaproteobacteria bacterium]|nr:UbiH/UbiF/VisC/COQ6 family ubiquinone biosynthesis hydroxylase [Gammaproteobacteria bacterium]
MKQHDVVIVGDGAIGLSLTLGLLQRDIDVALISMNKPIKSVKKKLALQDYDIRVSAITRRSEAFLKSLDAWQGIEERRISPFREMHVWDAAGNGSTHFDSAWTGATHMGHIIENKVIIEALEEKLADYPDFARYTGVALTELMKPAEGVILKTAKETFFAKLLIGADGANSWVREHGGFGVKQHNYDQTAIVATVNTEKPHHETAWQRFMPTGPLAFLPLNQPNQCSIVWSCNPDLLTQVMAYDDAAFCQHLADAFEFKLGRILSTSPRLSFPLIKRHAEHYIQPHIALVGDAAHTIHPLAGQGMNMGLRDIAVLLDVIDKMRELNRPLGCFPLLRQYEREQRTANACLLKLMDGFKEGFGSAHPLLVRLRNQGMNLVERGGWLKAFMMQIM